MNDLQKQPLPTDEELIEALRIRVNPHRFTHIMGVAGTAKELARVYGLNEAHAYTAGLLHDWDKCYNDEEIRARIKELRVDIEDEVAFVIPQALHGFTAAAYFDQTYDVDAEIIQAVRVHTTGSVEMSDMDMVLYIADGIEPSRPFERLGDIRAMVGVSSLEDLFTEIYGYWIELLIERKKTMHPVTMQVWNRYAKRWAERNGVVFDRAAKRL